MKPFKEPILDTQEPHATLVTLTTTEQVMELALHRYKESFTNIRFIYIQLVVVMLMVLVVCNVLILMDSAPVLLVTRV